MKKEEFIKEIKFAPAFDKRDSNPSKNYGIHGVDLYFYLKGVMGVVQFVVYTNWQLPHVQKEIKEKLLLEPFPADLGYHSYKQIYKGQKTLTKTCPLLENKPCYYDGSGLNAEPVFKILLEKGSDGVWEYLEEYYNLTFKREKEND